MKTHRIGLAAIVTAFVATLGTASARADETPAAEAPAAPSAAPAPPKSFEPHLVGDVRGMLLVRSDDNYFRHASTFHYDLASTAPGVAVNVGVELHPRFSFLVGGHYAMSGADRADARLRLLSGAVLGTARFAFLRQATPDEKVVGDLAATAGFGRYFLRETYVNPALSPTTFKSDDGSFGIRLGMEPSLTFSNVRVVGGYAFHYAPATVGDRIGGSAYGGGHEISLGVGVRL